MPLEIVTVPCLQDNYAYLVHSPETGETAVVDVPEDKPIRQALQDRNWQLSHILITHHHGDHIGGVETLREASGARVIGASADAHRLPRLDQSVGDGDRFSCAAHGVQVLDVSGHTLGHIAFYMPDAQAVFTADSLMALGCGRVFEGTPEQMWASLSKLAALPGDTLVYSGHEYTETNASFALTIELENPELQARVRDIREKRAAGHPTVPSLLSLELATNPFLRAGLQQVKAAINMPNGSDSDAFAEIRQRKDRF